MSVTSNSMTYSLKGPEIVDPRVTSHPADVAISKLRWLGLEVQRVGHRGLAGQFTIEPERFQTIAGLELDALQRFRVVGGDSIQVVAPSPLARIQPIPFLDLQSRDALMDRIGHAWLMVLGRTRRVVDTARQLAPDAQLLMNPWRVEGTLRFEGDSVRVLFSSNGDRACVCGLNGRALTLQPNGPRVIIPVRSGAPEAERGALWRTAVEQARSCVGSELPTPAIELSTSIDLVSQDLEDSYLTAPRSSTMPDEAISLDLGPALPDVVTGVGEMPPPRLPPQPQLASASSAMQPIARMPVPMPPASSASSMDSFDLSLDLETFDLPE